MTELARHPDACIIGRLWGVLGSRRYPTFEVPGGRNDRWGREDVLFMIRYVGCQKDLGQSLTVR